MALPDFRDNEGKPLPGAKMLAEIMQQKELIKNYSENEYQYELTELGQYIAESGGWLVYVEKLKKLKNHNPLNEFGKPKRKKPNIELIIAGIIIVFLSCLIVSCI
jgi:hypothetical protein